MKYNILQIKKTKKRKMYFKRYMDEVIFFMRKRDIPIDKFIKNEFSIIYPKYWKLEGISRIVFRFQILEQDISRDNYYTSLLRDRNDVKIGNQIIVKLNYIEYTEMKHLNMLFINIYMYLFPELKAGVK